MDVVTTVGAAEWWPVVLRRYGKPRRRLVLLGGELESFVGIA